MGEYEYERARKRERERSKARRFGNKRAVMNPASTISTLSKEIACFLFHSLLDLLLLQTNNEQTQFSFSFTFPVAAQKIRNDKF